jgi:GTP-binding protein HflX
MPTRVAHALSPFGDFGTELWRPVACAAAHRTARAPRSHACSGFARQADSVVGWSCRVWQLARCFALLAVAIALGTSQVSKTSQQVSNAERALLVGIGWKRAPRFPGMPMGEEGRESLLELVELATSAGAAIVSTVFQVRDSADPATLVGRGKLDEIHAEANAHQAQLIIFDSNLSPVQQRNIEEITERRVIDRTQLILDIFARHARSREGQLQVELAQLNYMLPRLTGKGTAMSRLGGKSGGGGSGGAGGGAGRIGVRGPGEKKLETDRRRIRDRVSNIKSSIEDVRKQRALRRDARNAVPLGTIALVGYTNAGKSTLFNALSKAEVLVSSRMFATLDPTIRALRLPSHRRVLVSDTVGFIRDLPKGLLIAFRATLEEVQEAALILHVSDVSNPHHAALDAEVCKILAELGVSDRPVLRVLNKIDRLAPAERKELAGLTSQHGMVALDDDSDEPSHPNVRSGCATDDCAPVLVSGLTGEGIDELLRRIDMAMPVDPTVAVSLRMPLSEGRKLALIHAMGKVLRSEVDDKNMFLEAEVPESIVRRLRLADYQFTGTFPVPAA